jgi:hypothetical protein
MAQEVRMGSHPPYNDRLNSGLVNTLEVDFLRCTVMQSGGLRVASAGDEPTGLLPVHRLFRLDSMRRKESSSDPK